ncbi:hypothetical protein NONO_c62430 [Nocardia nova SH22a]|uniref:DUF8020 domain-containing protein n=1 Tax=Nocardia nova SH22a TaxID=1415166 RepID=W5TPZ9_9NOCA|nr:hypothetical protein [Nocardia nova]AHH21013.1 hypothetical protein NONO_c62430 [Nocardia nova SH22a]
MTKSVLRKSAPVLALLAAAVTTAATATAAPSPGDPPGVHFTAAAHGDAIIVTTDSGTLGIDHGKFEIKAADGTVVAGTPLDFRVDDFRFPITADIAGHTATLTPHFDIRHAAYQPTPVALPYEDQAPWKTPYDREQAAWTRMTTTISVGATLGTLIGGVGGAATGCVLGGIAGATIAAATIVGLFGPFIPAAALGCLGGVIAMAPLGTVAGLLLVTAPVALAAITQYFTTINEPFPGK